MVKVQSKAQVWEIKQLSNKPYWFYVVLNPI